MADGQEVKEGEVEQTEAEVEEAVEVEETAEQKAERENEEKEKKFTNDDMKKARESFQREAREREARIIAETEARVLREALEGKAKSASTETSAEVSDAPIQRPVRPVEKDFETTEEFHKAQDKFDDDLYEYRRAKDKEKDAANAAKENENKSKTALHKAVESALEEGRKLYPDDFSDVVTNNREFRQSPMMVAAITKLKNAPDVIYYLGKNLEENRKLVEISDPIDLALAMKEISDKLPKREQKAAPKVKTGAPKPAATVQAKARVQTDSTLEGKSQADRIALLEEASKNRRLAGAGRT